MNHSESIKELATALAKAQGAMGPAVKDKANPFFKSVYADLSSVVQAIREPLSSNGLSFVQCTLPSEKNEVQIETMLMHNSGEWLSSVIAIPVSKADAQGYGSAITYAKRYGLQSLLGVPSDDDDGNAAAKAAPKPEVVKTVSQSTWEALSIDEQTFLGDLANEAIAMLNQNSPLEAANHIKEANLDADETTAIWSRFDSKQRSAMKKAVQDDAKKTAIERQNLAGEP